VGGEEAVAPHQPQEAVGCLAEMEGRRTGRPEDEEERRQRTKWRTRRMGLTGEEEHWAEG
jgi:hypothetical protein